MRVLDEWLQNRKWCSQSWEHDVVESSCEDDFEEDISLQSSAVSSKSSRGPVDSDKSSLESIDFRSPEDPECQASPREPLIRHPTPYEDIIERKQYTTDSDEDSDDVERCLL